MQRCRLSSWALLAHKQVPGVQLFSRSLTEGTSVEENTEVLLQFLFNLSVILNVFFVNTHHYGACNRKGGSSSKTFFDKQHFQGTHIYHGIKTNTTTDAALREDERGRGISIPQPQQSLK